VARALKTQYLWIDSLYIVQDDDQDWEKESSEGRYVEDFRAEKHFSYWTRRGWTFQEEYLSTRLLYFGNSKVHFACCSSEWSEGDKAINRGRFAGSENNIFDLLESYRGGKTTSDAVYIMWTEKASHYSSRILTYPTDKLPAIAGVARFVAEAVNDQYIAGLWRKDLTRGLLWVKRTNKRHVKVLPEPYIAPTWSWAASDVDIYFPRAALKDLIPEFEVESIRVDVDGENPYGKVRGAELVVTSSIITPATSNLVLKHHPNGMHNDRFLDYSENTVAFPSFDFPVETGGIDCEKLVLLPLFSEVDSTIRASSNPSYSFSRRFVGLMIHPSWIEGKFYRVGTFRTKFVNVKDSRTQIIRLPEKIFCII
jgi:hypothetical protein